MARALWLCCVSIIAGCVSGGGDKSPAVFGGEGATIASPDERPLPADGKNAQADAGPCGAKAPAGDVKLLDDFEDGDAKLFKTFQREGWWYAASDNTEGSTISPQGQFVAELLAAGESDKENRYAAHLKAAGQTQWGVAWSTSLNWVDKGVRCPFNASSFGGVKFRAKGPGTVRVSFNMPETVPKDNGGICTEGCWDHYGKPFLLSDKWEDYTVRWDKLQQGGWGAQVRFDPTRLIALNFAADVKSLPIDFWVDDIEFLPADGAK
ncbi:MAG TPA: hypothetical protein VM686_32245 [Polyangiaceae bacterium]|nr:hypothetical protein [Polyangiaceae bacterium]